MIGLSQLTSKGLPSPRAGAKVMLLCMLALGTGDAGVAGVEGLKLTVSVHRAQVEQVQGAASKVLERTPVRAEHLQDEKAATAPPAALMNKQGPTAHVSSRDWVPAQAPGGEESRPYYTSSRDSAKATSGTQQNQQFTKRGTVLCAAGTLAGLLALALVFALIGMSQSGKFEPSSERPYAETADWRTANGYETISGSN